MFDPSVHLKRAELKPASRKTYRDMLKSVARYTGRDVDSDEWLLDPDLPYFIESSGGVVVGSVNGRYTAATKSLELLIGEHPTDDRWKSALAYLKAARTRFSEVNDSKTKSNKAIVVAKAPQQQPAEDSLNQETISTSSEDATENLNQEADHHPSEDVGGTEDSTMNEGSSIESASTPTSTVSVSHDSNAIFNRVNNLLQDAGKSHQIKGGMISVQATLGVVGFHQPKLIWDQEISKYGPTYLDTFDPTIVKNLVTDTSKPKTVIQVSNVEDLHACDALFAQWKREGLDMQPWLAFTKVQFNSRGGHPSPATTIGFISQILLNFVTQPRGGSQILNTIRQDIAHVYGQAAQGDLTFAADIVRQAATIESNPVLQEAQSSNTQQANAEFRRRHTYISGYMNGFQDKDVFYIARANNTEIIKFGITRNANRRPSDPDHAQRGYHMLYRFVLRPDIPGDELETMERELIDWGKRLNINDRPSGEEINIEKFLAAIGIRDPTFDRRNAFELLASLLVHWNKHRILQLIDMKATPPQICDLQSFMEVHEIPPAIAIELPARISEMQRERKRRRQQNQTSEATAGSSQQEQTDPPPMYHEASTQTEQPRTRDASTQTESHIQEEPHDIKRLRLQKEIAEIEARREITIQKLDFLRSMPQRPVTDSDLRWIDGLTDE